MSLAHVDPKIQDARECNQQVKYQIQLVLMAHLGERPSIAKVKNFSLKSEKYAIIRPLGATTQ